MRKPGCCTRLSIIVGGIGRGAQGTFAGRGNLRARFGASDKISVVKVLDLSFVRCANRRKKSSHKPSLFPDIQGEGILN